MEVARREGTIQPLPPDPTCFLCSVLPLMLPCSGGPRMKMEGGHTSNFFFCVPPIVKNCLQMNNITKVPWYVGWFGMVS